MLVLNIINNEKINIKNIENLLKIKGVSVNESVDNCSYFLSIFCEDKLYNKNIQKKVIEHFTKILYSNLIKDYSTHGYGFIYDIYDKLEEKYFYLERRDFTNVQNRMISELIGEDKTINKKFKPILTEIKSCIHDNEFNINGLLTFRKNKIINQTKKVVPKIINNVVENYLKDKKYRESVKKLKDFTTIEKCKIDKIIITIKDDDYSITDLEGNDLYKKYVEIYFDEVELNKFTTEQISTFVISIVAPRYITIYNKENCKDVEFLKRIDEVFEDRVMYCI